MLQQFQRWLFSSRAAQDPPSSGGTGGGGLGAGTPMGLLLTLTYSSGGAGGSQTGQPIGLLLSLTKA